MCEPIVIVVVIIIIITVIVIIIAIMTIIVFVEELISMNHHRKQFNSIHLLFEIFFYKLFWFLCFFVIKFKPEG